jgi:hypothetical protein
MFKAWILFPKAKRLPKFHVSGTLTGETRLSIEAYCYLVEYVTLQEKSPKSQPALAFCIISPIDFSFHDISPRAMIKR